MQKKFKNIFKVLCISPLLIIFINLNVAAEVSKIDLLKINWSFEGIFGKFDRAALLNLNLDNGLIPDYHY